MVDFQVFLRGSDIDPIAVEDIGKDEFFFLKQRRKQSSFKGVGFAFRHVSKNRWFEHIDAGIDVVAGDFGRSRLLYKTLDPPGRIGFDQAICRWIFHRRQYQSRDGVRLPMPGNHGIEIEAGEDVTVKDDCRGIDLLFGILKRAPGSQGCSFDRVLDGDAVIASILQKILIFRG